MNLADFLTRTDLKGLRKSRGGYLALCPAHDDHSPSLSLSAGDDGRVLLHCWAGCETKDILAALGLTWRDLFPERSSTRSRR